LRSEKFAEVSFYGFIKLIKYKSCSQISPVYPVGEDFISMVIF